MVDPDDLTYRDTIRTIAPKWLRNGTIGKVLYAIGAHLDAFADAAIAAARKAMPEDTSEDAASLIAEDRRMVRGPNETWESFQPRLRSWRQAHQRRGGPYALLEQLHATTNGAFSIDLYYYGTDHSAYGMAADGTIGRSTATLLGRGNGHWLLVYAWPTPLVEDGLWSDPGEWDDGGVWDSDLTPTEVADLRRVPSAWNAAHAIGHLQLFHSGDSSSLEISVD
jgi:hypothetical protein